MENSYPSKILIHRPTELLFAVGNDALKSENLFARNLLAVENFMRY